MHLAPAAILNLLLAAVLLVTDLLVPAAVRNVDLAYVACGRYDGFWEFGLSPWDMAAGALLISEAGGLVSDLRGDANYLETGNVIAGTPKVFAPLLKVVQGHLPESVRG